MPAKISKNSVSVGVSRSKKITLAMLGVLALAGGAWGIAATRSKDKKVAAPKGFSIAELKAAAEQDPRKVFEKMHQAMESKDLTDAQRHAIWENMHVVREAEQTKRINAYFAAKTEAEKQAMLDKDIDRHVAMSKEFEQRRAERQRTQPNSGGEAGAVGRGPSGPGGPAAGQGGTSPGGGRDGKPPSRLQRKAWSESHNPDLHAREEAYHAALHQRAQQRGIELRRGPGR